MDKNEKLWLMTIITIISVIGLFFVSYGFFSMIEIQKKTAHVEKNK